jgi:ABC-type multidrug transport system ATPase subunit
MEMKINNLSKTILGKNKKKALNNINLSLKSPSLVGLLGPNGAGKSTLMKLMVGQLLPTTGSIMVDGHNLMKNEMYLKHRLGYLPQEFGLYDDMTVYEFLLYMACLKQVKDNRKGIIDDCMQKTDISNKKNCKIKTLSGGQTIVT